jgi:octaprenyl-diphosphate synthase
MTDLKQKLVSALKEDLSEIERALNVHLNPHFELVREVAGHLLFAGGKRLRPLLMMLAARLCGYADRRTAADYAVIFEFMHVATLLHDDVVDGGELRRGRPTAHRVWDPATAVLTGDYLLARALWLATRTGIPEVIEVIAGITEEMAQGEIRQLYHKGDITLSEQTYQDVIRCKTAVLFQGACRVGALIAGAQASAIHALSEFGLHLGMAFQMADDLLDYTQDTSALGKKAGADLREGKLTLPLIHTLREAPPADRKWIETLIAARTFTLSEFAQLQGQLQRFGGIDYTRDKAADHIAAAKQALAAFDPAGERRILEDVVDYAWSRAN